ncbi:MULTISPECIES: thioredoxin fold domain-containing protein [Vibrio]|uniref:Thiol:disulfide interchange protein n=1 Tax=Vibrio kanaloae TaxID=170673 RepID=A0A4U1Z3Y1_9VIBR|nr:MULTISPECIES: thioredoxin fold domain-containing protein [Vibrio]TKF28039.1 thiol:disulfide interchange protein [Vibrio kanaloae]TKF33641.1 thiol:disulfide interchange protein [Vibrio kanaloae]TKF79134.1 thiol:disulfide interchange protein [Vibrio kanaloae]
MSVLRRLPLLALPLMITACNASEAKVEPTSTVVEAASAQAIDTAALTKRFEKIGIKVDKIVPSDIDGLLEVQTNSGVIFSSPEGDHFLAGTLYSLDDNGKFSDVLAERQAPLNAEKVAAMSDTVIEYKADNEKHVVTVFTDITCGYCVRLHSQMQGYNDLGITVRYMAYPRQGATGQVADQMAAIWASDDPKTAMHDAKVNRQMPASGKDLAEQKQIIVKQYQLGRELGINGTPAIVLESGELVSGYLPPAQLLQRLEQ